MIPFFSRRIGLNPDGDPIAVKYGGKFTGQAGKWNLGFIHIKDDNEWDNPGYTIGRVTRNFGKQSSIGVIGTHGNALSGDDNGLAGLDLRLASSTFNDNKNIVLNMYAMKSFTTGLTHDDVSFGTELNYPNDLVNFRIGYLQVGENFVAGLGFVPRSDIRNFYGSFRLGPRPKIKGILQVKTGFSYMFISDRALNSLQSAEIKLNYGEIDFLSGDIIALSSSFQFESLQEDFDLFEKYTINAGDYPFWNHSLQLISAKRRKFWAAMQVGTGSFYSGTRTDWIMQVGYKVFVPVYVGLESDRKYIHIDGEQVVAQIYRFNLNLLFSPNLSLYSFAQYDNQTETIGWQSRFQWIIRPGKEIFFVWNSPHMDPYDRFNQPDYEARLKVNYTIRF